MFTDSGGGQHTWRQHWEIHQSMCVHVLGTQQFAKGYKLMNYSIYLPASTHNIPTSEPSIVKQLCYYYMIKDNSIYSHTIMKLGMQLLEWANSITLLHTTPIKWADIKVWQHGMARASNTDYTFGLIKGCNGWKSEMMNWWTRGDKWGKTTNRKHPKRIMLTPPYPNPQVGCLTVRSTWCSKSQALWHHDHCLFTCKLWSFLQCFPDTCSNPWCSHTTLNAVYVFYHPLDILLGAVEHTELSWGQLPFSKQPCSQDTYVQWHRAQWYVSTPRNYM